MARFLTCKDCKHLHKLTVKDKTPIRKKEREYVIGYRCSKYNTRPFDINFYCEGLELKDKEVIKFKEE